MRSIVIRVSGGIAFGLIFAVTSLPQSSNAAKHLYCVDQAWDRYVFLLQAGEEFEAS